MIRASLAFNGSSDAAVNRFAVKSSHSWHRAQPYWHLRNDRQMLSLIFSVKEKLYPALSAWQDHPRLQGMTNWHKLAVLEEGRPLCVKRHAWIWWLSQKINCEAVPLNPVAFLRDPEETSVYLCLLILLHHWHKHCEHWKKGHLGRVRTTPTQ